MQSRTRVHEGPLASALAEATGRERRLDPVLPGTGGPAGNAILTAWTGLVLLVLSMGELLTLFNVHGLLTWHVAIGALLVPPALMKTASTGWRVVRYYRGQAAYRQAGPPPPVLRLLGPLVVVSTLGLLGSGVLLILLGEQSTRQNLISLVGFGVSWVTLHQGFFIVWATATGLHLLGRIVPALRLTLASARVRVVPGGRSRAWLIGATLSIAAVLAVVLVRADGTWRVDDIHRFVHPPGTAVAVR